MWNKYFRKVDPSSQPKSFFDKDTVVYAFHMSDGVHNLDCLVPVLLQAVKHPGVMDFIRKSTFANMEQEARRRGWKS